MQRFQTKNANILVAVSKVVPCHGCYICRLHCIFKINLYPLIHFWYVIRKYLHLNNNLNLSFKTLSQKIVSEHKIIPHSVI